MVYLYLPTTRGAAYIYMKFVRPFVAKHGASIDQRLGTAIGKVSDGGSLVSKFTDCIAAVKDGIDHVRDE